MHSVLSETSSRRFRERHPRAALLALVAGVFLLGVLTGVALRDLGGRSAAEPAQKAGDPWKATRWWRTRFPPASVTLPGAISDVRFNPADVLPGLTCGSLDGATLSEAAGAFLWGWAYDPRSNSPALAVILFDNGRQLPRPVHVFRERPDVAAAKGETRLVPSGWSVWLPPGTLPGGKHVFEAFALFEDHKLGQLGGKISVESRKN
jgi:hypothetical protein